jgi:hypothetical protein
MKQTPGQSRLQVSQEANGLCVALLPALGLARSALTPSRGLDFAPGSLGLPGKPGRLNCAPACGTDISRTAPATHAVSKMRNMVFPPLRALGETLAVVTIFWQE